MNTLIYRRVSTDHQDNSLQVQEAMNDEYCRRMGLVVVSDHADADISGSIPFLERPQGRALLSRVKLGDITHVVTSKQDRLGRDTLDSIATVRALWTAGITPHFTAEGGAFPRTSQNELLFEIKASVAQYERNLIRERTTAVLRMKARRGELTGTVTFGQDVVYTFADGHQRTDNRALFWGGTDKSAEPEAAVLLLAHGRLQSKMLVANPDEQLWLRQMHAWRLERRSFKWIANQLNAHGVRSKQGGLWQTGNVDRVLKSRFALALLQTPILEQAA